MSETDTGRQGADPGLAVLLMMLQFHGLPPMARKSVTAWVGSPSASRRSSRCPRVRLKVPRAQNQLAAARQDAVAGDSPAPGRRFFDPRQVARPRDSRYAEDETAPAQRTGGKILVQFPLSPRPQIMTRTELEEAWDGRADPDDAAGEPDRSRAPLRHRLVSGRDAQIPPAARRGAGRLVLPAGLRAGLAVGLPGRHRQGAGPSQHVDARRADRRPSSRSRSSRRSSAPCAPICSRTPPTASMSSSAPGSSVICWPCRSPISGRAAPAIRWRGCANSKTSAIS